MDHHQSTAFRIYLAIEFSVLFLGIPIIIKMEWVPVYPILTLWIVAGACLLILMRDGTFDRSRLWRLYPSRAWIKIGVRFAAAAGLLLSYVIFVEPLSLFYFPRQRPLLWVAVIILYPLLSVYPQAIIYRAFLFNRYAALFSGWLVIAVSAAAFSFMHIIFENPLAVILTLLGGLMFAKTYEETGSLVLSGIEHALYGGFLFTIGLGKYFYYGAVV
jgi:membrane protease YdiL (CAAX protease family)